MVSQRYPEAESEIKLNGNESVVFAYRKDSFYSAVYFAGGLWTYYLTREKSKTLIELAEELSCEKSFLNLLSEGPVCVYRMPNDVIRGTIHENVGEFEHLDDEEYYFFVDLVKQLKSVYFN